MKHIIDTDELEKLPTVGYNGYLIKLDDLRALIANSPQADGMVLVPIEPTAEMIQAACDCQDHDPEDGYESEVYYCYKAMLSAYKPQADDVRKDAERFRSIAENKFGVHFENNTVLGEIVEVYSKHDEDGNCQCDTERTANTPIDALRLAIDKARE